MSSKKNPTGNPNIHKSVTKDNNYYSPYRESPADFGYHDPLDDFANYTANDVRHSISPEDEIPPKELRNNLYRRYDNVFEELEDYFGKPKTERQIKREKLDHLCRLYHNKDKASQRAKGTRTWLTVLAFTAGYFALLATICYAFSTLTIQVAGVLLVISFVLAWLHFFLNLTIFAHLVTKGREENEELERIKDRIEELKKEIYK